MDFRTYVSEWDRLYSDAEQHGLLSIGDTGKCWLFWSRASLPERQLADLRLKVNGDLSRYRDMIRLQLKISKNELASSEQASGYRNTRGQYYDQHADDYYDGYEDQDGDYDDGYYDDQYDHDSEYYQWNGEYYDHDGYDDDHYDDNYDDEEQEYDDYFGKGKGKGKKGKGKDG